MKYHLDISPWQDDTSWWRKEATKALSAGMKVGFYKYDFSTQEDTIMITHSVSCCKCGKSEILNFKNGNDIVYLSDMLIELGWTQDKYGRWFCDICSYESDE